jgi:hypothetical protein
MSVKRTLMKRITLKYLVSIYACNAARVEFADRFPKGASVKVVFDALIPLKLDWANWLIVRLLNHKNRIRYAVYAAEQVVEIFEKKHPDDKRPRKAIEAAKAVSKKNNEVNRDAATDAAAHAAANATHAAAHAAANAAYAAVDAANAARAAYTAAYAADAAYSEDAADAATKEKIIRYGLKLFNAERLKEGG